MHLEPYLSDWVKQVQAQSEQQSAQWEKENTTFFQRLPVAWRPWVDGLMRLLVALMFAFLAWRSWLYGTYMQEHGIGTMTLKLPMFWVMRLMSFSFAVTVLVKMQHVLHPGKEMMKG